MKTIDEVYSLDLKCKSCKHSLKKHEVDGLCGGGLIHGCECMNFVVNYSQVLKAEMELTTARAIIFKQLDIAKKKYIKDYGIYSYMTYAELQKELSVLASFPYYDPEIEELYKFIIIKIETKLLSDKIQHYNFKTT